MLLGKVISRVVATAKSDRLPSRPMLEIEPLAGFGKDPLVAIDGVAAGPGDWVLVMGEGTGARQVVLEDPAQPLPAQLVVVGVVDRVDGVDLV